MTSAPSCFPFKRQTLILASPPWPCCASFTIGVLTYKSTNASPETLSFSKARKTLTSAFRAESADVRRRVHLVDGCGSVGFYPWISNQPVPSDGGPGAPDSVRGKNSTDYRLTHIWESNPWVSRIALVGIEAAEHPHDALIPIPDSTREWCLTPPIRFVGIDVVTL